MAVNTGASKQETEEQIRARMEMETDEQVAPFLRNNKTSGLGRTIPRALRYAQAEAQRPNATGENDWARGG